MKEGGTCSRLFAVGIKKLMINVKILLTKPACCDIMHLTINVKYLMKQEDFL